jgi:uncharacterized protein with GYD domain
MQRTQDGKDRPINGSCRPAILRIIIKEFRMAKYLFQSRLAVEGVKGLLKEGGSARRAAVEKTAQSMGGKLEAFYFAFGDTDVFLIADLPDNAAAAAVALTVSASGLVVSKTTVLLTPEEMDIAVKKTPNYRPPGQ